MSNIMNIDSVQQYNDYFGIDTLHPLVTVIEGCKGKFHKNLGHYH